jgi:CRP/FNR family cyclic AMP-dependent transcriptional regulator
MHERISFLANCLENLGFRSNLAHDLATNAHVLAYERGAMIFHAGEPADLLYILLSGELKLYYGDAEGRRVLAAICGRGVLLGSLDGDFVPGHRNASTQLFTAEALSQCKVAVLTKARATAALHELDTATALALLQGIDHRWARFTSRFLAFMMMDVRARLLYAITRLADKFGIPDPRGKLIPLRLSHEDFGELVAASRPMVSKHLKELAKKGIFYKQDGRYILSDRAAAANRVAGGARLVSGTREKVPALERRPVGMARGNRVRLAG